VKTVGYTLCMILFKAKFKPGLLDGSKTTTLRAWKRNLAKAGQVSKTNLGVDLAIHEISRIRLEEITDAHAVADGFLCRGALMEELKKFYPTMPDTLTLIRFSLAKPAAC